MTYLINCSYTTKIKSFRKFQNLSLKIKNYIFCGAQLAFQKSVSNPS
jgi:hypothetical protein